MGACAMQCALGTAEIQIKEGSETEIKNLSQCVEISRFWSEPSAFRSG
jgi:hypothetical protein